MTYHHLNQLPQIKMKVQNTTKVGGANKNEDCVKRCNKQSNKNK